MKKIEPDHRSKSGPVHMYLDDLDEIYKAISRISVPEVIVNEQYRTEELSDIRETIPGKLSSISFRATNRETWTRAYIDIDSKGLYLSSSRRPGDAITDAEKATISEIEAISKRCLRRVRHWRFIDVIGWALPPLGFAAMFQLIAQDDIPRSSKVIIVCIIACLSIISVIYTWNSERFRRSIIYPIYRREKASFWSRKRDDLLLLIISSALSLLFGLIGGLILGVIIG
ncbi:hypothetical protein [Glycomyces sp. NPDC047010]|uniref:hypothetical protein n=1 Tax=Glycomyces sp. NPDC047010 TaxID=3155023 RepID=UPI0033EBDB8B